MALTVAQARALRDLLDAGTALSREHGDTSAAHDPLQVPPRRPRRPPPPRSPDTPPAPVLPRTPGPPPRRDDGGACVVFADDEETV